MADRSLAKRVGAAVRAARLRRGRTQDDVAEISGIAKSAISKAENGHQLPTLPTLIALAKGIGVPAGSLVYSAEAAK